MTTEALSELDTVAAIRLENLFAEIRREVIRGRGRPFQMLLDAKFTEDGRLVGDAEFGMNHRFDTQSVTRR